MSVIETLASLMSGLGLFFIGVRALSGNLVPLIGRRTRILFAHAMRGPVSSAISGTVAGLATQSSSAVSWVVMSFIRAGIVQERAALGAPIWSAVGTAMLPLLVAVDTNTPASFAIGIVGIAIYFHLIHTQKMRHAAEAILGAAMLLYGMHILSNTAEATRDAIAASSTLTAALKSEWLLATIGFLFAFAAQSTSVATAVAVAAVRANLIAVPAALPLIAGANAAGIAFNILHGAHENVTGRLVFWLQVTQKAIGALLLTAFAVDAAISPEDGMQITKLAEGNPEAQIAIVFTVAQVFGSLVTSFIANPVEGLIRRMTPQSPAETLSQPAFLLREALKDPAAALDLAVRELARLGVRLPLMLDHVRAEPDTATPPAATLKTASVALSGTIKSYLTSLLDNQPGRSELATALLLEDASGNLTALYEALAEFVSAVPQAADLPTTGSLIEALHMLLTIVADYAEALDDPDLALRLLGDRDQLMEDLRQRLSASASAAPAVQDATFRMTILFERVVWLARRVVINFSQAQRALSAED
ncbi:MAG TPA: Na/Pi symporter [Alphaproteobacteria bacterium]|nr:Na/Pi symporter [Alphaproteobacteria bacterium]